MHTSTRNTFISSIKYHDFTCHTPQVVTLVAYKLRLTKGLPIIKGLPIGADSKQLINRPQAVTQNQTIQLVPWPISSPTIQHDVKCSVPSRFGIVLFFLTQLPRNNRIQNSGHNFPPGVRPKGQQHPQQCITPAQTPLTALPNPPWLRPLPSWYP